MKENSEFNWKRFVHDLSPEELENLVLEMTRFCPTIVEKYRMRNLPEAPEPKIRLLKKKVDSVLELAIRSAPYDDYYDDGYGYDDGEEVTCRYEAEREQLESALSDLVEQKAWDVVHPVAEYGIGKTLATEEINPCELLEILAPLYVRSASAESPKQVVRRMEEWECGHLWGNALFFEFPAPVQDLWYERAKRRWAKLPKYEIGTDKGSYEREIFEKCLIQAAEARGDDAFALRVREANLNRPKKVVELLAIYHRLKLDEKILPMLRRMETAFGGSIEIQSELVKELQSRSNTEEALAAAWRAFEGHPTWQTALELLLNTAESADRRAEYLERALECLAEQEKCEWANRVTRSVLQIRERRIEILLDEAQLEQAWELREGAALSVAVRRRLADMRGQTHPADAAALYRQWLMQALEPTGQDAYAQVIALLKKYEFYLKASGKLEEFTDFVGWIREEYRRRRNLMKELDAYSAGK